MKRWRNRSNRGFVVAIALIAIMVMTFFLLTGAATTTSAVKVSGNYSKTVDVFNIAEAGLAKARPMLEGVDFSDILTAYTSTYLIPPTSFNGGTYEVTVRDDPNDGDADPWVDKNGIIQVTSVGKNSQGGKVQIRTYLQLIGGTNPIESPPNPSSCGGGPAGCNSAGVICGTTADVSGAALVDGDDHAIAGCSGCSDPPTTAELQAAAGCTGSGCNIPPTTTGNFNLIAQGGLTCWKNAEKTEPCTGTSANVGLTASNCTEWQTFYNQWASVSASAPGVVLLNGDSYTGPDVPCSTPKVFLINTSEPVYKIEGNHYLCGTFIIASNTSLSMSGTISLVGLFLMMGNYSNVTFTAGSGTINMTGKLIFKSTTADAGKELIFNGGANLVFSSAGVGFGMQAINNADAPAGETGAGSLLTAAWEETY